MEQCKIIKFLNFLNPKLNIEPAQQPLPNETREQLTQLFVERRTALSVGIGF